MNAWREIAELLAGERCDASGHFYQVSSERDLGDGTSVVSTFTVAPDGIDELIAEARVLDDCAEALAAVTATLGMCEHGIVIPYAVERGELKWSVNSYVAFARNARPTELVIMLWGFHEEREEFCAPWAFNPAGVLYPW